jgi:hypothetical protein
MNMSNLSILTLTIYFTNLPLPYLFNNKLTKHQKINNMKFMNLIMLFDFIRALHLKRSYSTKDYHFLLILYLLQFNYCKTDINL